MVLFSYKPLYGVLKQTCHAHSVKRSKQLHVEMNERSSHPSELLFQTTYTLMFYIQEIIPSTVGGGNVIILKINEHLYLAESELSINNIRGQESDTPTPD